MEKRKFRIDMGNYWTIGLSDRKEGDFGELEPNDIFLRIYTKEGRIHILHDSHFPLEDEYNIIKQQPRFNEVCTFEVYDMYKEKIVDSFEGNFIDALLFVRRNFYIFQYEEGVANSLPKWLRDELEAEAKQ